MKSNNLIVKKQKYYKNKTKIKEMLKSSKIYVNNN